MSEDAKALIWFFAVLTCIVVIVFMIGMKKMANQETACIAAGGVYSERLKTCFAPGAVIFLNPAASKR